MKKLISLLIKLTIILLVAVMIVMGVVAGFVYYYQDSMIFSQSRFPPGKVYDVPSNYETIVFTTDEGYKFKCWFVQTEDSENSPTLMYNLGNGSYKESYIKTYNFLAYYVGVNVFSCSNRGSGDYEGKPTEAALYKDANMFIEYIINRVGNNALFLHGRSMGGAVALETAIRHQEELCGLTLENTFLSIAKIAKEVHPVLSYFLIGFTYLIRTKMDNESKIKKFRKPIQFLISRKDQVVNPKHMDTLYELSESADKSIFENPNGTHHSVETGMQAEFAETYKNFIDAHKQKCYNEKVMRTQAAAETETETETEEKNKMKSADKPEAEETKKMEPAVEPAAAPTN